jgi:CRISPR-associated protein (TIGR03986 family)
MAIKHRSPEDTRRTARAPYNFVTLPAEAIPGDERAARSLDRYEGHTGRFVCTLRTWSPLYVRGMMTESEYREYGHKAFADLSDAQKNARAKFFENARRQPQIPASSLRGMLRNIFEIVSYGKMSRVSPRRLAYRSFGSDKLKTEYMAKIKTRGAGGKEQMAVLGGYLRKVGGDWFIQPAKEINGTTFCRVKYSVLNKLEGKKIENTRNAHWLYFEAGPLEYHQEIYMMMSYATRVSTTSGGGLHRGAHVKTGDMHSKRSDAIIFEPDGTKPYLPLAYEGTVLIGGVKESRKFNVVEDYRAQISEEQKDRLGTDGALNDGQPVFYLLREKDPVTGVRNVEIFGHSMMLRLVYPRSLSDMVPKHLRSDDLLDIPDAVFGFVKPDPSRRGKDVNGSGRLSFSPARLTQTPSGGTVQPFSPQILSSPKPTTFQHYLMQDAPDDKGNLKTYLDAQTTARGHKLYWHKDEIKISDLRVRPGSSDSQLTRIVPMGVGAQFEFTIDFENLSDVELGALAWTLELAGRDSDRRFKLGMGKPLGMGAVSIDARIELEDRSTRYEQLLAEGSWSTGKLDEESARQRVDAEKTKFERYVLDRPALNPGGKVKRLIELERMRELFQIMSWPGPEKDDTRYLEIERNKGGRKENEYKERPVLPSPLNVDLRKPPAPKPPDPKPPPPPKTEPEQKRPPTTFSDPPPAVRPPPPPPPRPPKQSDDIMTVTVLRIDAGSIVCKLPEETVVGKLPLAEWRSGPKPIADTPLRVRVLGRNQAGEFKLTLKGVK